LPTAKAGIAYSYIQNVRCQIWRESTWVGVAVWA